MLEISLVAEQCLPQQGLISMELVQSAEVRGTCSVIYTYTRETHLLKIIKEKREYCIASHNHDILIQAK
jgi:hypothetical protein